MGAPVSLATITDKSAKLRDKCSDALPILSACLNNFCFRVENIIMDGGFAMICGDPGQGKSKVLQFLSHRLEGLDDVVVGIMERPQSSLSDFYRELGELFGVNLRFRTLDIAFIRR